MSFSIQAFDRTRHQRAGFNCGQPTLATYLHQQAAQDVLRHLAALFVVTQNDDPQVLGYYTLSAFTVTIHHLTNPSTQSIVRKIPRYPLLPATLIGRLAVDVRMQGQRLGEKLLIDALRRVLYISNQIASLAVVVDAIDDRAAGFYTKYGFMPIADQPRRLFLPMASITQLSEA